MARLPFSDLKFGTEEADPKIFAPLIAFEALREAYFEMAAAFNDTDPERFVAVCNAVERNTAEKLTAFRTEMPAATSILRDAAREIRHVLITARTGKPPVDN